MNMPNDTRPQKTRRKFAAMVGVYFVGTFNDNFCRQCVMLLAVAWGLTHMPELYYRSVYGAVHYFRRLCRFSGGPLLENAR